VNAVYHRSYESEPEPIKVYLHPDRIEIISYPGPFPGILKEDLERGNPLPPLPARNRRIGEFLKELKLAEGRGTGVPKIYKSMEENGSPKPRFDFDESRTYFRVTLPAHPEYVSVSALRSAAYLKATGKNQEALALIKSAWESHMHSATLAMELIGMYAQEGKIENARKVLDAYAALGSPVLLPKVVNTMIDTYYSAGYPSEAKDLLKDFPPLVSSSDALHTAIISRRMGEERYAHVFFERAGDAIMSDPRALQEFAQTKMKLASDHYRKKNDEVAQETNRRLLKDARELLERVLQMDTDRTRKAWAWRDLARVKSWLNAPDSEIESAYKNAIELLPQEQRFKTALSSWRNRKR
jgi:ATP-dependent DNA helicase RecG